MNVIITITLISYEVPNRPWAKVEVDLFTFNERDYLIIVDYFSGFWEIDLLDNFEAKTVIGKMKSQLARYGVPDVSVSDDGRQFVSEEYKEFQTTMSSSRYPRGDGRVENAVQAVYVS